MKHIIKHLLLLTDLFFLLPSFKVYAAETAAYKIQWEFYVTNTSNEAVTQMTFGFDPGRYALESSYQPGTKVSLSMATSKEPYEDYGFIKLYKTNLQAGKQKN